MSKSLSFSVAIAFILSAGGLACSTPVGSADDNGRTTETTPSSEETSNSPSKNTVVVSNPTTDTNANTAASADKPTCAVGIQTATGCEVTYDIGRVVDAQQEELEGFVAKCEDGNSIYNGCSSTPLAFRWQDHGTAQPKTVRVEMQTSLFCADPSAAANGDGAQQVSFNGGAKPLGSFEGDPSACTCAAAGATRVFELDAAALAEYHSGGNNVVKIAGKNRCLGMKKNAAWDGAIARITVSY